MENKLETAIVYVGGARNAQQHIWGLYGMVGVRITDSIGVILRSIHMFSEAVVRGMRFFQPGFCRKRARQ